MSVPTQLELGYVCRAHGLTGEVGIKTFDPGSQSLFQVDRVVIRLRDGLECEMTIDSVRSANKEVLLGFEGVESRGEAERLVGGTVFAFREDLDPPEEGECFQGDLIGLTAVDSEGVELGKIAEVWNHGSVPNLVIRAEGKDEMIVPFIDEFVPIVDMEKRQVVVKPPEFLE